MSKEPKIYTRKLGVLGSSKNHSYYLTLPISFVRKIGLKDGQQLEVRRIGKKIQISAATKTK